MAQVAHVLVMADDLSGAAETAIGLCDGGLTVELRLQPGLSGDAQVTVVDTDSRGVPAEQAADRLRAALSSCSSGTFLLKKTDSLWRGNIGAELGAITATGRHVLLAGALPHLERTVRAGRPMVAGTPLRDTELWRAEGVPAPEYVTDVLCGVHPVAHLRLADLRGPAAADHVRTALRADPTVVVLDGETLADVERSVELAARLWRDGTPVALAGSGQLAPFVGRAVAMSERPAPSATRSTGALDGVVGRPRAPLFVVVGSAAMAARAQIKMLVAQGFEVESIDPRTPGDDAVIANRAGESLARRPTVVTVAPGPVDPRVGQDLVRRLADVAAAALTATTPADLIMTGGETARAVLDRLEIATLRPIAAAAPGAVVSCTPSGRLVGTKPGSFGGTDALADLSRLIGRLRTQAATAPTH